MTSSAPRDQAAFEVRAALREPGCAVCTLSLRSVERLLQAIAYEQVNDLQLRQQLRYAAGFCNPHAYQWLRESRSVLGTALIYQDVIQAALRELDASPRRGLFKRPAPATCPACQAQREAEARYLDVLLALVAAEPGVLDDADGLCRLHLLAAARSRGDAAQALVEHTRRILDSLLGTLEEVIRKEDYRFRGEARTESERTAPARAIAWAAGLEGLTADRPKA